MNQKINFVTVCTESYTSEYAIKSLSMFSRNYSRAFNSFCITDKKEELQRDYETIDKNKELSGWWNKLSIFGLDLPGEFTVYVDLDLLILNDITHIIDFAVKNLAKKTLANKLFRRSYWVAWREIWQCSDDLQTRHAEIFIQ